MENLKEKIAGSILLSESAKKTFLDNFDNMPEEIKNIISEMLENEESEFNRIQSEYETGLKNEMKKLEEKVLPMVDDKEGLKNFINLMNDRMVAESLGKKEETLFPDEETL